MKRIVKLSLILLIMISMIFCAVKSSYATLSSKATITSVSEVQKGEEFTVSFNLSNLKADKGINVLRGTLKYDEESLTLVKMEGQNSWSNPSYNEENGTFIIDRDAYMTTDGAFMRVTFRVKNESKQSINISIEKISVSNEDEEIDVSSTSKSIALKGSAQTPDTNTNTNSSTNTNVNSNKNNTNTSTNGEKNGSLPNTGSTNITSIIIIAICVVIITVFIIRLKAIKNKGKH